MDNDPDRLLSPPHVAWTCPICACPAIGVRCANCGHAVPVDDDADEPDDATDTEPTQPDDGLPPLPDAVDLGGEAGP